MKYHYFYKITNNVNGKYYYGVHNTDDLNDGYMGSSKPLRKAYEKYGIENFTKEILKYFETTDEAFQYEREIVNEDVINDKNCYNIQIGGKYFCNEGMVVVKDKDGNRFWIKKEEYIYDKNLSVIWKGKHHKEDSKNKTREKLTPKDSKNPRIWVNKNGVVKYLLKTKLEEYISNGWKLGRTGYIPRQNCQGKVI